MSKYHQDCLATMKETDIFPIEVDLSRHTFTYDKSNQYDDIDDDDDEILDTSENICVKNKTSDKNQKCNEKETDLLKDLDDAFSDLNFHQTDNSNKSTNQNTVDLLGDLISTN